MKNLLDTQKIHLLWILSIILFASHSHGATVNYLYDKDSRFQEVQYENQDITCEYDNIGNKPARTIPPAPSTGPPDSTGFFIEEYAYNDSGFHSRISATTNKSGKTVFNPDNFQIASYIFRNNLLDLR